MNDPKFDHDFMKECLSGKKGNLLNYFTSQPASSSTLALQNRALFDKETFHELIIKLIIQN